MPFCTRNELSTPLGEEDERPLREGTVALESVWQPVHACCAFGALALNVRCSILWLARKGLAGD